MFVEYEFGTLEEYCEKAIFNLEMLEGGMYLVEIEAIADMLYARMCGEKAGFEAEDIVSIKSGTGKLLIGEEREDIASMIGEAEKGKTKETIEAFFDVFKDVFGIKEGSE